MTTAWVMPFAMLLDARWLAAGRHPAKLLSVYGVVSPAGWTFLQWWRDKRADALDRAAISHGIVTRWFDEPRSLRFGLPADDAAFRRLEASLASMDLKETRP